MTSCGAQRGTHRATEPPLASASAAGQAASTGGATSAIHARPPLVLHRVQKRHARRAGLPLGLGRVGVGAFARPSIRDKWVELGGAAAQRNDRRHKHVGHRGVQVEAADEREPKERLLLCGGLRLSAVRDGFDRRYV
eukprot:scaffold145170_cov127-Phaeocystis_antarctica.AAC.2